MFISTVGEPLEVQNNWMLEFSGLSVDSKFLLMGVHIALSYEVVSESEVTPCIKIDKPLAVYRFLGIVMK